MVRCLPMSVPGFTARPTRTLVPAFGALVAAVASVLVAPAVPALAATTERVEIVLEPSALPRGRSRALRRPRAVDRGRHRVGPAALALVRAARGAAHRRWRASRRRASTIDTAIVNFDSLEADVTEGQPPAPREARLRARRVRARDRDPVRHPRQRGARGASARTSRTSPASPAAGVTVAVIDSEWDSLSDTIAEGDLPAIPVSMQLLGQCDRRPRSPAAATTAPATASTARRRPRWCTRWRPDATLLLYKTSYNGAGTVTPAAIKTAIRHAADQGAKVILVPLHVIRTMSDPRGTGAGRRATRSPTTSPTRRRRAATVVVPAGNEALRHYAAQVHAVHGLQRRRPLQHGDERRRLPHLR